MGIYLIIQTLQPHPELHGYKILQPMSCHNNKEDTFDTLIIFWGIMVLFITVIIYMYNKLKW